MYHKTPFFKICFEVYIDLSTTYEQDLCQILMGRYYNISELEIHRFCLRVRVGDHVGRVAKYKATIISLLRGWRYRSNR